MNLQQLTPDQVELLEHAVAREIDLEREAGDVARAIDVHMANVHARREAQLLKLFKQLICSRIAA